MRAVLRNAQHTGDVVAPWREIGEVDEHFEDPDDLLVELHREWLRLLVARLHRGEVVAERTPTNVRDLYDEVCGEHRTLRRILDAHTANPALRERTAREHAMLARIAGLAPEGTLGEVAAAAGRSLVSQRVPTQRSAPS
ncbi:MAG TPA: hypothetical protein VFG72_10625 [Marmoricola sp.]|nr:hypothetical protein [Marmoricola sp.]